MGRDPWLLEALGGAFAFGADENNAHVQPNGQYHYHGIPEGVLAKKGMAVTLVGFAMGWISDLCPLWVHDRDGSELGDQSDYAELPQKSDARFGAASDHDVSDGDLYAGLRIRGG